MTETGAANHVQRRKVKCSHVEVVIVIAHIASESDCCMAICLRYIPHAKIILFYFDNENDFLI
jgi:hypothetical protein